MLQYNPEARFFFNNPYYVENTRTTLYGEREKSSSKISNGGTWQNTHSSMLGRYKKCGDLLRWANWLKHLFLWIVCFVFLIQNNLVLLSGSSRSPEMVSKISKKYGERLMTIQDISAFDLDCWLLLIRIIHNVCIFHGGNAIKGYLIKMMSTST